MMIFVLCLLQFNLSRLYVCMTTNRLIHLSFWLLISCIYFISFIFLILACLKVKVINIICCMFACSILIAHPFVYARLIFNSPSCRVFTSPYRFLSSFVFAIILYLFTWFYLHLVVVLLNILFLTLKRSFNGFSHFLN